MEPNPQNDSERFIQEIIGIRFLADFVFPNPQYRKGKISRELADLIVAIGDTLMVFQIKTHFAKSESAHDVTRATRKITEAYRQFRALLEGIGDKSLRSLKNSRGIEVPFDLSSYKQIYLIVILDYIQGEGAPPLRVLAEGCEEELETGIVVSVYVAADFLFLAHQFDTIKDFCGFLDYSKLIERKFPSLLEIGLGALMAHYKLYPQEIVDLIDLGKHPEHLKKGVADDLPEKGFEEDGDASYFFDEVIGLLHATIGKQLKDVTGEFLGRLRTPINSSEAYWLGISALADTSRLDRHEVGSLMMEKLAAAQINGGAYGAIVFEKERKAILVYCNERSCIDAAKDLTGMALILLGMCEIDFVVSVGLPIDFSTGGFAVLLLRREWVDSLEDLKERIQGQPVFSSPKHISSFRKKVE